MVLFRDVQRHESCRVKDIIRRRMRLRHQTVAHIYTFVAAEPIPICSSLLLLFEVGTAGFKPTTSTA